MSDHMLAESLRAIATFAKHNDWPVSAERCEIAATALTALEAERDALKWDAERYRWLAADGDRALKVLQENSGHEVEDVIDVALAALASTEPTERMG